MRNPINVFDSIIKRQNSGEISAWQGAAEADAEFDKGTGDLHFYCDTTRLRDVWDGQEVMVFPHRNAVIGVGLPLRSNTGLICQGERRGCVILAPGATETNAHPECLKLWGNPGERKWNPQTQRGERRRS